jgi:hypothetical protein
MIESEIRQRLMKAVGETRYPADLPNRLEARLVQQGLERRRRAPAFIALVAAVLAAAVVAALIFVGQPQRSRQLIPGVPNASATPAASASPSPSPSPSQSPVATPAGPPASTAKYPVLCRLPIDRGNGAFLDIPVDPTTSGSVDASVDDPSSNVKLPNGEPRVGLSYDWPMGRWLPVPHQWAAPDGAWYAYTDSQARVHQVGVSDGSDQVIASGASWGLYGYGADGLLYGGQRDPSKQPSLTGLWRLGISGGPPQQVTSQGTWLGIGSDAAWSMVSDGAPPSGYDVPEGSLGTVLQRLDLKTGAIATWYTSSTGRYRVGAVDTNGRPVLVGVVTAPAVLIVTARGTAQSFNSSSYVPDVMADAHGVWYLDPMLNSVYLTDGSQGRRMGQFGSGTIKFAGQCK